MASSPSADNEILNGAPSCAIDSSINIVNGPKEDHGKKPPSQKKRVSGRKEKRNN